MVGPEGLLFTFVASFRDPERRKEAASYCFQKGYLHPTERYFNGLGYNPDELKQVQVSGEVADAVEQFYQGARTGFEIGMRHLGRSLS
ncbi:MAG: hypothetical protein HYT72_05310 [Candidatus Aenigmarchaeota archaeon]|nr:hypothetical protein [Candidatus Aenigmarchaeota archaeon]